MKKILFIINQFYCGGAEKSLLSMLKRLDPKVFSVDLVISEPMNNSYCTSLIPEVPKYVRLYFSSIAGKNNSLISKIYKRLFKLNSHRKLLRFIRSGKYDLAVSCGEWFSPELVMKYARADRKAIWLHSDISRSPLVDFTELFRYDNLTDYYICVSKIFAERIGKDFPFLQDRIAVVHNSLDIEYVLRLSNAPSDLPQDDIPILLSVGNFRPEKNYLRAVAAAHILKQRGLVFRWICLGSFAHETTVKEVRQAIHNTNMENDFILLGAVSNPYKYMKHATMLISSSDYESWSMVLNEAIVLRLPIVTTRTDGALEQIRDAENGFLCDFSEQALANKIELLLKDQSILEKFRLNLSTSKCKYNPEEEITCLLKGKGPPVELLSVIDDVNYCGGAHKATYELMKELSKRGFKVEIFSGTPPSIEARNLCSPVRISSFRKILPTTVDSLPFRYCIFSKDYSMKQKWMKFYRALLKRIYPEKVTELYRLDKDLMDFFRSYPVICIMSEGSLFRRLISELDGVIKIQMIHTHYQEWIKQNDFVKTLTAHDYEIYKKMDRILLISEASCDSFIQMFPQFYAKSFPVRNIIITHSTKNGTEHVFDRRMPRLLTVARLEREKDIPRMIRLAARLKKDKIVFDWQIYGSSAILPDLQKEAQIKGVSKVFHLNGYSAHLQAEFRRADLMVLLSHYEGLPTSIYESFMAGTPVLSTRVGGVSEQILDGVNGFLVDDDEEKIYHKMKEILLNPEILQPMRNNLRQYHYDNVAIVEDYIKLLGLKHQCKN